MSSSKIVFYIATALMSISAPAWAEGLEGLTVFGSNPQMTEIGDAASHQFNYNSYGTREIGAGVLYDNDLISLSVNDPRDNSAQRTKSAILAFRSFGETQWGLEFLHFKGFGLHDGTDSESPTLADRDDLELWSTQFFILRNINHPEYSVQEALIGLKPVTDSGWAAIYGGKTSNTYIEGNHSIVPSNYSGTSANRVNSYNLVATAGLAGTFIYHGFYVASQLNLGAGPLYTTWKDENGNHKLFQLFGLSHVMDLAFGYSAEKWTLLLKISTLSDSTAVDGVSFENLSTNSSLIYSYRF